MEFLECEKTENENISYPSNLCYLPDIYAASGWNARIWKKMERTGIWKKQVRITTLFTSFQYIAELTIRLISCHKIWLFFI